MPKNAEKAGHEEVISIWLQNKGSSYWYVDCNDMSRVLKKTCYFVVQANLVLRVCGVAEEWQGSKVMSVLHL